VTAIPHDSTPLASALQQRLVNAVEMIGMVALLAARTARQALKRPLGLEALLTQIESIGIRSLSVVGLTAVFSSMVITIQFSVQLSRFGAKEWAGNAVGVTLARELGPVMTALMVGGRVGAGIAAELGSMSVTEQIDAVRALGADPVKKLVVPLDPDVHMSYFIDAALRSTTLSDYFTGLAKTFLFALNISLVACHLGMNTRGGTVGVGRATTHTVVITSVVTLISDFFMTKVFIAAGWGA
jgi:phospholipid/cholesterol/gamma-HCH transport system permease protein